MSDSKNLDKVKCKLCGKEFSGGAYRIKEHIAKIPGNVYACPRSSKDDQEKCKTAIEEAKKKKKKKVTLDDELRQTVNVHGSGDMDDVIELEEMGSRKMQRTLGPMDKFATNINPESRPLPTRQQNINDALWKEKLHKVQQYIARWVYALGVHFNTIANDEFKLMAEAIGKFGPGVTPQSQHQLREPLLKEEVDRLHGLLKPQEEEWKKNGCKIMTDAWSDRKRRSIMNLCVNCKGGTMFRSSKDSSDEAHTGGYIFEYVKGCIEEIGEENVVQVVTDNAANNMVAARMMKEIKPSIFWTSCATHSINLMLESISKLTRFKGTIQMAKDFTIFIYAHHKTLAVKFWNGVIMCLNVFGPLVKLLRLVDGDKKPTMVFLHGELIEAKKQISDGLKHVEKNVKPILSIIEEKIKGRLDNPLHLTGYLWNPYYFYKDSSQASSDEVSNAVFKCVSAFFPNDVNTQCQVINSELAIYKNKEGNFGKPWAIIGCQKEDYDPVYWWETYGNAFPNLAKMAKRILALTTSSSGCE
ncbi:PREDICTED: uncharacterized protein LOC104704562 [Camelina sativa]|uniref:Uncharacterized protein LOC104704562 n=1 Tax=Camelina sativa TaxID=90675 RepID=A0ABM0T0I4_CAMSA|nr:PREDICTED: uncharacterized protein LOC104704562 [Camelina sativa]